jgi:hypothetical protein
VTTSSVSAHTSRRDGPRIYVARAACVLTAVGGWLMRRAKRVEREPEERPTMQCPDCAETILAVANVCRYCGHRFTNELAQPSAKRLETGRAARLSTSNVALADPRSR